ncbi:MAG TPA: rod shape-determining protein MreD [Dehalococcoidia bacterium]|nr:rod shape-determining protein MreD [Dehalococcoidia bacterium]
MSYYVGIVLVFLFALAEASVMPMFRVHDLQPNLVLILLVVWLVVRGQDEAYVLIPIGGVIIGLVDGAPMGTALLGLAPIALLQELRGAQLTERGFVVAIAFCAVLSLTYNYAYLAVFTLEGQSGSWLIATTRVILPTVALNLVVLLPSYAVFLILNKEPRRSVYAY